MFLRQSTSQVIRFGPCLDQGDGVTEETALTLAQADMRLSKDGGAFAQKNATGNATHDSDGWYSTTLNATDTDTVGKLILNVHQPANMLPVKETFFVIEEAIYDLWFDAGSTGLVTLAATTHTGATIPTVTTLTNLPAITANWLTATGINADAITSAKIADNALSSEHISAALSNKIADHIWRRTVANVEASSDGDTIGTNRGAYVVLAVHNNRMRINGSTLEIMQDDDVTVVINKTVTTNAAADPITELDTV